MGWLKVLKFMAMVFGGVILFMIGIIGFVVSSNMAITAQKYYMWPVAIISVFIMMVGWSIPMKAEKYLK